MPYTTHGHWVGDGPPTEPGPQLVACGGPGLCPTCNQEAASAAFFEAAGRPQEAPEERATEAVETPAAEAMIDGQRSHADLQNMVRHALEERLRQSGGSRYVWVYIADMSDAQVVYSSESGEAGGEQLWQCSYAVGDGDAVTLGEPEKVARSYTKVAAVATGNTGDDLGGDDGQEDELGAAAEAFAEQLHPRGAAGTAVGGQFVAGSAASAASSSGSAKKEPAKKPAEMGFDGKTGTGYGQKGGDATVRRLQQALNAAGLKDAAGKPLVVDGKLGPKTTQAIKAAQKRLGMKPTGRVTADFVNKVKASKGAAATPAKSTRALPAKQQTTAKTTPKTTPKATTKPGAVKGSTGKEAAVGVQRDRIVGRVVEALDDDPGGGRVFRVRIIAHGDSKNMRRYPKAVLEAAAGLYQGAKAYDHHRSDEELATSTIAGLIGHYRNVEAAEDGLYGDLHLLPSATHAAETLDATLAAQEEGLPPLIGVSHDVYARYKPVTESGKRLQEAIEITRVNSADLVADPAAGGKAVRMVAAGTAEDDPGTEPDDNEEDDVPTKEDILSALAEASEEELAAVGLSKAGTADAGEGGSEGAGDGAGDEGQAAEATQPKGGFIGQLLIKTKVEAAGLPARVAESLTEALPDWITEADVDAQIASLKTMLGVAERAGLAPKASLQVTQESLDKKKKALDAFFEGNFSEGYTSFRQAWADFTGNRVVSWDVDVNRLIMRESAPAYDSSLRAIEALDTTSWAQVLGDSITRRLVAMYRLPGLQSWRQVVSSMPPINDFRTQRIGRVGGYGVLPDVLEGAPYQPLTSPGDEEATYAITKRGGTEELTMEMIANDDIRAIAGIPAKLGRAAAQTLYRFVWDILRTNATCTYDSVALFHASHGNLDTSSPLSDSTLLIGRRKMREQVAYGDSVEVLGMLPRLLVVPPELEGQAFKLTRSAVAVTSTEDATTPNIHSGLDYLVVDYFSDANDWFLIADPNSVPTIEVGFYRGRQDPELFSQTDPTQGAVFAADKILYKIRHIYSGTVLDHRGFYSGQG
ncbi:peptidoglycan-binding protein [Actinomadura sp. ATCC 31491]|uniref:Peptidoglycan-binding protein n=1 Tax=Actinomadura luzonensis TaxID=2805427 RepID=A0ABT0FPK3_9ACTN|nr:peptidoglycan-binding domain-containing protein [Actinomadura luzonensis]MCK2214283.1 peptidoglycan-binding protein [Actinomadura luzonensis]